MLKNNRVSKIENIVLEIVVMASTCIIVMILYNLGTNTELFLIAYAEQGLTIEYNIQTESQLNNCTYVISISVWDNKTMKAIPNALVVGSRWLVL